MSQIVVLKLYKNNELIKVKQFDSDQVVIGRSPEAQIVIDDNLISLLHAVVERRENKYFVSDLGSETGVYVNNEKILESEIGTGQIFSLGEYSLHFFIGIPKPISNFVRDESAPVTEKTESLPTQDDVEPSEPKSVEKNIVIAQQFSPNEKPKDKIGKPINKTTYAPSSEFSDIKQIIRPEKGTIIEVVVAWGERVISTAHFSKSGSVYIGSDSSCDIVVPILGTNLKKHKLLKIDSLAHVLITSEMDGEYIHSTQSSRSFKDMARNNQMEVKGSNFLIHVAQGDMVVVRLAGGMVSLAIRYVSETPKPALAPFFDLTASEVAGVILAIVVASIFSLYMMVYAPEPIEDLEAKADEPLRKAVVTFKPPKPKQIVVVADETKKPVEKKVVEVKDLEKKTPPAAKKVGQTGKAGSVQKTEAKVEKKTPLVQQKKQGGAVNTGASGASAKSNKPDPMKSGILSVFGKGGTQEKLNQVYSGSGELTGMAEQATGKTGFNEDRAGKSLGARTKEAPGSGSGKQSIGVSGPITDGRGAGNFGFGSGSVGKKGSVQINIGGQEEAFVGSIDKEAIRRVILDNISQIRNCYERVLNQQPDLFGKLVIEWDIEDKGRVRQAKAVSNSTGSSQLATCVVTRLKSWRFPEPPDDQIARVTYPFVFAAK